MTVSILLADDFPSFRKYIRTKLESEPGYQVVAEAADGLSAVQKAEELKPEIVLLDIAMPWMDGCEAARRIRQVSPASKIVFLTAHESLPMVTRARELGACGYLIKSQVNRELFPALKAVILGHMYFGAHSGD